MNTYRADVWARRNGTHFRATVALDNHEPTRAFAHFDAYGYSTATVSDGFILCVDNGSTSFTPDDTSQPPTLRHATNAVYLLDFGDAVTPYYVAGWHEDFPYVMIHPFPTTEEICRECGIELTEREEGCDACYRRKQRNGFRPTTYGSWALGPRTAYHVKLREESER
jgi:hypothetical protein